MNKFLSKTLLVSLSLIGGLTMAALPINPPNVPLETGGATGAKPNIMFILDDSGSMASEYLGDEVAGSNCKLYNTGSGLITQFSTGCSTGNGEAPWRAAAFNKMYYNPAVTYKAGVLANGTPYPDQALVNARSNIYQNASVTNLTTLQEVYYCTKTAPTPAELANTAICRRNGIDTPNPFNYYTQAYPDTTFRNKVTANSVPHYFTIQATDYCDSLGANCSNLPVGGTPTPVRWCIESAVAQQATVPTGKYTSGANNGRNRCQNYYTSTYRFPRYGNFLRVNVSGAEATNFANWYTYHRSRMLAMKTAVGLSFKNLDNSKRVGFITINPGSPVAATKFLSIKDFDATQKADFYSILYSQTPSSNTPLREALARVGRYFAGKNDGINTGMINGTTNKDPMQFSCQQNFSILSTDGYWNSNAGQNLTGGAIPNSDNVNSGYSSRASGSFDGNLGGNAQVSLSDVAMYYYKTDLRPTGSLGDGGVDVSENNVPISAVDTNTEQHMVTYAISLGMSGFVQYTKDYYKGTSPDFENIKAGAANVCSWTTGTCNWPIPTGDNSTIDDLWHATVNGRGRYFNAQNSEDLVSGLEEALNTLVVQTGASASAATSSPNITSTDNYLFYSTYRTKYWDGEIAAKTIDANTGAISPVNLWSARTQLATRVTALSDTRNIYYVRNSGSSSSLRNFEWSQLNSTEKSYFENKCPSLSQCVSLTGSQISTLNSGDELLNYLRGQFGYEQSKNLTNPLFRDREFILGDIVDSSPVYVGQSRYNWTDTGYMTFAAGTATRDKMLYFGANDGMLHALNPTNGSEKWSIIPAQVMDRMWRLADTKYDLNHRYYVNGPITVMDAKVGASWKTVLITAMGQGSKGFMAIDITNPNSPQGMWEFCDSSVCSKSDGDMGLTFGGAIITKRAFDDKWVAYLPSGYDSSSGKGVIYEVDIVDGSILRKLTTGTGTAASPAGLAKINAYYDDFNLDNKAKYIYAGDMDGNVWKWDLTSAGATTAQKVATLRDSLGNPQPITTKVEVGRINGYPVLFVATGRYLTFTDYNTTAVQSVYAIKDTGSDLGNFRLNPLAIEQTMTVTGGISATTTSTAVDFNSKVGWYVDLKAQPGERVNIDPVLALGTLNVISNIPGATACLAGGNAWYYQFDFLTGGTIIGGDGFSGKKLGTGLIVGQVLARLDGSGGLKNFITDAGGNVSSVGVQVNMGALQSSKAGWRTIYKKK